jgi:hypothetical protein
MAIRYNTGSSPNTSWTSFTSTGTSGTDEIYVRTSTATGALSTSTDQKVSKVYVNNGSSWVEVFSSAATVPPVTPTLGQVTGFDYTSGTWNTRVDQQSFTWTAVSNATGYVLSAFNERTGNTDSQVLVSSATGTLTGLTPGETYSFSVYATASGYNSGASSTAKRMTMGSKGVGFLNRIVNAGPFYFSQSANCSTSKGNTMSGSLSQKTNDNYVGYLQITGIFVTLGYYNPAIGGANNTIQSPDSDKRDTVLNYPGGSSSLTASYGTGSALYSHQTSPGWTSSLNFSVVTSGTGWTSLTSGCAFQTSYTMVGTNLTTDGTVTSDNQLL